MVQTRIGFELAVEPLAKPWVRQLTVGSSQEADCSKLRGPARPHLIRPFGSRSRTISFHPVAVLAWLMMLVRRPLSPPLRKRTLLWP